MSPAGDTNQDKAALVHGDTHSARKILHQRLVSSAAMCYVPSPVLGRQHRSRHIHDRSLCMAFPVFLSSQGA